MFRDPFCYVLDHCIKSQTYFDQLMEGFNPTAVSRTVSVWGRSRAELLHRALFYTKPWTGMVTLRSRLGFGLSVALRRTAANPGHGFSPTWTEPRPIRWDLFRDPPSPNPLCCRSPSPLTKYCSSWVKGFDPATCNFLRDETPQNAFVIYTVFGYFLDIFRWVWFYCIIDFYHLFVDLFTYFVSPTRLN